MGRFKIQPRRIVRDEVVLNCNDRNSKQNLKKLDNILAELNVSRRAFVRKAYKRCHNYHLTYSKVFPKWRKNEQNKKLVSWFKRQPLYPGEVNLIVNMMFVLNDKFQLQLRDGILEKAIFLSFMLSDDLDDRFSDLYKKTNKYVPPSCFKNKPVKAQREMKARGFIHINQFHDYRVNFNHVVSNIGNREYYYPINCFSNYDQLHEGYPDVHVMQRLTGVPGFTAVNYFINDKSKKNER